MTSACKIPEWEWEFYKDNMETLYLAQNMTREQVMKRMDEDYSFRARYARRSHRLIPAKGFQQSTVRPSV